jgi:drug/metabolite transporter (DMT)-like permease
VSPIFKAAFWMAGWLACMLIMAVAGRETTRELDVFQVMMMRSLIGLVMLYPLIHLNGGLRTMRTAHPARHLARNVAHYGAQFSWLMALNLIPLAQVISIEFTMPIWTAIFAVIFLGERMGLWKNLAVVLGLVGVAIIVRPFNGTISPGQLIALCAALGFATSVIFVKALTRTDKVVVIMFWMMLIQSAIGLVPGLLVWQAPSAHIWPWIIVISFVGTYSHYCMARAMLHADATVVVPMDFLRVPLAALVGWLVYSEKIDIYVAAGAALILTGNLLNLKSAKR